MPHASSWKSRLLSENRREMTSCRRLPNFRSRFVNEIMTALNVSVSQKRLVYHFSGITLEVFIKVISNMTWRIYSFRPQFCCDMTFCWSTDKSIWNIMVVEVVLCCKTIRKIAKKSKRYKSRLAIYGGSVTVLVFRMWIYW